MQSDRAFKPPKLEYLAKNATVSMKFDSPEEKHDESCQFGPQFTNATFDFVCTVSERGQSEEGTDGGSCIATWYTTQKLTQADKREIMGKNNNVALTSSTAAKQVIRNATRNEAPSAIQVSSIEETSTPARFPFSYSSTVGDKGRDAVFAVLMYDVPSPCTYSRRTALCSS